MHSHLRMKFKTAHTFILMLMKITAEEAKYKFIWVLIKITALEDTTFILWLFGTITLSHILVSTFGLVAVSVCLLLKLSGESRAFGEMFI